MAHGILRRPVESRCSGHPNPGGFIDKEYGSLSCVPCGDGAWMIVHLDVLHGGVS